jgi:hypothetical protein
VAGQKRKGQISTQQEHLCQPLTNCIQSHMTYWPSACQGLEQLQIWPFWTINESTRDEERSLLHSQVNLDKTDKQAKLQCLQNRKKLKNPTK